MRKLFWAAIEGLIMLVGGVILALGLWAMCGCQLHFHLGETVYTGEAKPPEKVEIVIPEAEHQP